MNEMHFVVDVEADGPYPGDYSMSSIGVCAAVLKNNDKSVSLLDIDQEKNRFYVELKPISEQFVPEAAAVSGLDRELLKQHGTDPVEAMKAFDEWVKNRCNQAGGARAVFVGWPLSFDWMWTYYYLMRFNGSSPFGFSGAIDMRSFRQGMTGDLVHKSGKRKLYKELNIKSRPHTHNALDDAVEQADLWQALVQQPLN